jgi:arginine deiminase
MASFVQPANTLKTTIQKSNIITEIITELQKIVDLPSLKNDMELLTYICNLVENLVSKKSGIDKIALILEIFSKLFADITPSEIQQIESNIEYLINNKKIKKIPVITYIGKSVFSYLKKKL